MTVSGSSAVKKSDFKVYYYIAGSYEESFSAYHDKDLTTPVNVPDGKYIILLNLVYESNNNERMFKDFNIRRNDTDIMRCYTGTPNTCSSITSISNVKTGDRIGLRVMPLTDTVCHFIVQITLLRLPF